MSKHRTHRSSHLSFSQVSDTRMSPRQTFLPTRAPTTEYCRAASRREKAKAKPRNHSASLRLRCEIIKTAARKPNLAAEQRGLATCAPAYPRPHVKRRRPRPLPVPSWCAESPNPWSRGLGARNPAKSPGNLGRHAHARRTNVVPPRSGLRAASASCRLAVVTTGAEPKCTRCFAAIRRAFRFRGSVVRLKSKDSFRFVLRARGPRAKRCR